MEHTLVDSAVTSFPATVFPDHFRPIKPSDLDAKALKAQITEYKALSLAAELEWDRLVQLVGVLQKRVNRGNQHKGMEDGKEASRAAV